MHKISAVITNLCIKRNWISENDRPWCLYVVETKLLSLMFFSVLTVFSIILHVFQQTAIFVCTFYFLRKRYGGWHAPYAWLCQGLSLALVISVVFLLGPAMLQLPVTVIWGVNVLTMAVAYLRQPIYPSQAHFSKEVAIANNQKKTRILLGIGTLQLWLGIAFRDVLVYSFLGVLAGVLSVYIEIINQRHTKGRTQNEKVRKIGS